MKKVFLSLFIGSMVFSLVLVSAASADTTLGTNLSTTGTLSTTGAFSVNKGSTTAVQFQDGSGTALFIFDTTNTRFGANSGGAVDTTLEVGGTASISGIITLGGNGTTGGQIRPGTNGVTAFRFQNAAGTTNVLMIDTTNTRVGVNAGGAVDTTFEVGGLASISYASISGNFELTGSSPLFGINAGAVINTNFEVGGTASISGLALFGGNASVAGNFELTGSSALLGVIPGSVIDTTLEVGGTASISGIITLGGNGTTGGQIRPGTNGVTAFRFQNAAGTTNVLMIDTTNTRVGVNAGGAVDTTFEVGGLASISYASISGNFELTGSSPLFGINAGAVINTAFEVGGVASVGTNLNVGETSTATTSVTFETRSATQGACFIITGSNNTVYYARVVASGSGGAWKISTTNCNP